MTKKDYIKIAEVIKDINARKATGDRIAELFAEMLLADNERFNKTMFIKYIKGE